MVSYQCQICRKYFSTHGGLIQHANAKHHGHHRRTNDPVQQRSRPSIPEHDEVLWNTPITMTDPSSRASTSQTYASQTSASQTSISQMEDIVFNEPQIQGENFVHIEEDSESEPRSYHLRKKIRSSENIREILEESETEMQVPEDTNDDIDPEDLQGASIDDALDTIEGKNIPERIAEWPNDAYRDFMELIVEGNISNKMGDKIINFFNKHSNLEKSPLPSSTKKGKDYLNQINSPLIDFKEKIVESYNEVDFILYYRPIFRAIQVLLQRQEIANNFVYKGNLKKINDGEDEMRVFGEPYEGNWWLETEASLPPLNRLLSIILYSDATTFDGLGKTSGHPVFLTLGNLPNWIRNLPEAKILLGFLPKVQDTGIRSTENFRNLQREVYHKCFKIMLQPLLEKPDALYFGINGRQMTFAARISFFLADMLEADDVTATYKGARCKMPCHTCMVLQGDLNNMSLELEDMPSRTHENMRQAISDGQGKEFSVHSVKNAFWKFP
jgi:hypothetical protein